jgi:hypothetical protein
MDASSCATRTLPRPETGERRPPRALRSGEAALDRYRQACRAEEAARLFLAWLGRLHGPMA